MQELLNQALEFSDEQAMLLETAEAFFAERSAIADVRRQLTTEAGFDDQVWQAMVDLGWTALAVPEAQGGGNLSLAEAVTIAEPMGRRLCSAPFIPTQLFVQGLIHGGSEGQQAESLTAIAEGAVATVGLQEAEGSWLTDDMQATASRKGSALQLQGRKSLVLDAASAELLLVSVQLDGHPALVILRQSDLPSGALARETVIDETRRSYALNLDGIEVAADRLIADEGAMKALRAIDRAAWLLLSADATGGTNAVLSLTVDYLNLREAFGKRIGSYQALKHPCVEILMGLERGRSHLYHAATLAASPETDGAVLEVALRMAKAQTSETYAFAGDRAIQFHGAIGFTWECDAQLYLRRALWVQYQFGDPLHHRQRLAEQLL
jgi:acyl-CoA dehydrogenase